MSSRTSSARAPTPTSRSRSPCPATPHSTGSGSWCATLRTTPAAWWVGSLPVNDSTRTDRGSSRRCGAWTPPLSGTPRGSAPGSWNSSAQRCGFRSGASSRRCHPSSRSLNDVPAGSSTGCCRTSRRPPRALEIEAGEPRAVLRPRPGQVPAELAGLLAGRDVVDARMPSSHQSALVEHPVLVAIGTEPGAGLVVPLVGEPGRDAIGVEGPHLLDQPVVEFLRPLAGQELDDGSTTLEELRPVSPAAVLGVRQRDLLRITSVPGVLGGADLGDRVVATEGWNGWSRCHGSAPRLQSRSVGRRRTVVEPGGSSAV